MEEGERSNVTERSPTETNEKSPNEASWWGTWGQGWIDSVKEKSAVTLEMVKKDLNEFVDVIQGDTSTAISDTATKIEENVEDVKDNENADNTTSKVVKKGMEGLSKFLHSVSELMAIDPDDSKDEFITLSDDKFSLQTYNRKQEKLHVIQTDPGTYCNEPEGLCSEWLEVFNLDDHKTEMSELLVQNPTIRALYTQLVPNVVSHSTFWQRYFYRVFQLDTEERKREELLARANKETTKDEDADDGWGDDDDDDIEVLPSPTITPSATDAVNNVEQYDKEDTLNGNQVQSAVAVDKTKAFENEQLHKNLDVDNDVNVDESETVIESPQCLDEPTSNSMMRLDNEHLKSISDTEGLVKGVKEINIDSEIDAENNGALSLSCDTIKTDTELENELNGAEPTVCESVNTGSLVQSPDQSRVKHEFSETSSVSSWISIDDDLKVKKIKGEQDVKPESNGGSEGKSSSGSSAVVLNKSDADDLDEDFDLELDDDVNDEELAKLVEDIKNKSAAGNLQDDEDDDWENWE